MMNCFCGIVDRQKAFSLISSRDDCQGSSPSRNSDTPRAGFEPVQNLSAGLVEWSYVVVITTTPRCRKKRLTNVCMDNKKRLTNVCIKTKRASSTRYMQLRKIGCLSTERHGRLQVLLLTIHITMKGFRNFYGRYSSPGGGEGRRGEGRGERGEERGEGGGHTLRGIDSMNTWSIFHFLWKKCLCLHFLLNQSVLLPVIFWSVLPWF